MKFLLTIFAIALTTHLLSQTIEIQGSIIGQNASEPVYNATIVLQNPNDSSFVKGAKSDFDGKFIISELVPGDYIVKITSAGFHDYLSKESYTQSVNNLSFKLSTIKELDVVNVDAVAIRVEQKGDTTQYNADAYKVNPNASVEDLIGKMPGITIENGVVKSQGEQIKKVTIDGEDFFGDDVNAALKNLPADIVKNIQVFDNASDQAKFTGVSDGNEVKALNIVTKTGMTKGQFGKIYAGYGYPNNLYTVGANINYFKGKRKFSFMGMSNNINQQNFSTEDILGATGSTGNQMGGPRGGGFGREENESFTVAQQSGISTSHAIGLNYSDKWGEKTKFAGSYFFNWSRTNNVQDVERNYFLSDTTGQIYNEDFSSKATNYNHRLNLKFTFDLDSANKLTLTPKLTLQGNLREQNTNALTQDNSYSFINTLLSSVVNDGSGINASNSVLWMHKFKKDRRSFSANITGTYNDKNNTVENTSNTVYYKNGIQDSLGFIDLNSRQNTGSYGISGRFSYTEPLDSVWSTEIYYNPAYNVSQSDKRAYDLTIPMSGDELYLDTSLSNVFDNVSIDNEVGTSIKLKNTKLDMHVGIAYKNTVLLNDQTFPTDREVDLMFHNFLPSGRIRYEFSKSKSFHFGFRTSTKNPTIDQLQNVVDNSNPLAISSGNPELKQQYSGRFFSRYNFTNLTKGSVFFVQLNGELVDKYISNSSFIAASDTVLANGVSLAQGSQYRQPVNLNGNWNARGLVTYGFPIKKLKLNINLTAGSGLSVLPAQINEAINLSRTVNVNAGTTISSNISEKIDFTVNYTFNFNNAVNTIQNQANNQYFVQNLSASANWIIKNRLILSSNYTLSSYAGLSTDFNQTIMLWNAGVGYQFLKNRELEVRLSAFDILNNNNSITRNVTNTYIEDIESNVLNRYFMLTVVYNLKKFGSKKTTPEAGETDSNIPSRPNGVPSGGSMGVPPGN